MNVIAIGFQNAFLPNRISSIQQGSAWGNGAVCVVFSRTQQNPLDTWSNLTDVMESNITFPIAGDYSPSIFAQVNNDPTPIQYTFDQIKIHVLSSSEVNVENTNRINLGLTYAILAFSFIEGFKVLHDLTERKAKTQNTKAIQERASGNPAPPDKETRNEHTKPTQPNTTSNSHTV